MCQLMAFFFSFSFCIYSSLRYYMFFSIIEAKQEAHCHVMMSVHLRWIFFYENDDGSGYACLAYIN